MFNRMALSPRSTLGGGGSIQQRCGLTCCWCWRCCCWISPSLARVRAFVCGGGAQGLWRNCKDTIHVSPEHLRALGVWGGSSFYACILPAGTSTALFNSSPDCASLPWHAV